MKLKSGIDYTAFLRQIKGCGSEVTFHTEDGDILNLKSVLSQYIFLSASIEIGLAERGVVVFQDQSDAALLRDYLEA